MVLATTECYDHYQFDKAMKEVEQFAWHEFADHYVEMVKARVKDENDEGVRYTLYTVYLGIIKMMAPMMPHVTEDAYQSGFISMDGAKSIHVAKWPVAVLFDEQAEKDGDLIRDVIGAIRTYKSERKLSLNSEIEMVEIIGDASEKFVGSEEDISSTVRAKELKLASKLNLEEKVIALKPLLAKIGPTFKGKAKEVTEQDQGAGHREGFRGGGQRHLRVRIVRRDQGSAEPGTGRHREEDDASGKGGRHRPGRRAAHRDTALNRLKPLSLSLFSMTYLWATMAMNHTPRPAPRRMRPG